MKVAIVGANGQLGTDVVAAFRDMGHAPVPLNHDCIEIADGESVARALGDAGCDLIVNTAAMHDVERCERDPASSFAVNAEGARNLAMFSRERDVPLMHISTDYVFDGAKRAPYHEEDLPAPLNVYGNSKLAGEHFIRATAERYFIVRTCGLYGKSPCRAKGGRNFVELMLRLARERGEVRVVDDEVLTPTSTEELAAQLVVLAGTEAHGTYHATAEGSCSWYGFAREIFRLSGTDVRLERAAPGQFPAKVPRPAYSVLENRRLIERGLNTLGPWRDGLARYLGATVHA